MQKTVQTHPPRRLSLTATSLYAETLEALITDEAAGFRSKLPGSFKKRQIGERAY